MPDLTHYSVARPPVLVLSAIGTILERHHHTPVIIGSNADATHAAGAGRTPMKPDTDSPKRRDPDRREDTDRPATDPDRGAELPDEGPLHEIPDKQGEDPDSRPPERM